MRQAPADRPGGFLRQTYPQTTPWLLRATIIPSDFVQESDGRVYQPGGERHSQGKLS
jgi:hypothetical protein